jgi:hypothetical protein
MAHRAREREGFLGQCAQLAKGAEAGGGEIACEKRKPELRELALAREPLLCRETPRGSDGRGTLGRLGDPAPYPDVHRCDGALAGPTRCCKFGTDTRLSPSRLALPLSNNR